MFVPSLLLAAALTAAPMHVTMHPDATTTVSVGNAQGALTAASANGVVSVVMDASQPDTVDVQSGSGTGTDTIRVSDAAGDTVDIPVRVARDAGTFPSHVALTVTGSLQWTWLWTQIESAVARASTVSPGAALTVASPSPLPSLPPPGGSMAFTTGVAIGGNDAFFDASGPVDISVQNAPIEPAAPPVLLYDDDPETIDADGVLYRATVTSEQAASLYYYHDDKGDPRRIAVTIAADRPTDVQVIDSSSGPNIDYLSVGHAVSEEALQFAARNEGVIYHLEAGQVVVLNDVLMTNKQGVAGSIAFNVLRGGPLHVETLSIAPDALIPSALNGPLLPRDGHHRTGAFNILNFGAQSLAYAAGGPDVSVEYGTRANAPANQGDAATGTDFGDYGALHTFLFSLSNPLSVPATVYLYEQPLGGVVRSSFLVDGALRQVGCIRDPHQRYQISAFQLAPGGRYQLSVQTMTEGGSSYPVAIGLTGTPPQPSAPPISAPDGCFPKH